MNNAQTSSATPTANIAFLASPLLLFDQLHPTVPARQNKLQAGLSLRSTIELEESESDEVMRDDFTFLIETPEQAHGGAAKQTGSQRLYIIPPGRPVASVTRGINGLLIHFNDELFSDSSVAKTCISHRKLLKKSGVISFDLSVIQSIRLKQIVNTISEELNCNHPERNDMIAIKILELLILCESLECEMAGSAETIEIHPIIEQFNNLLERSYTKERSVRYYADSLGIHPNHLNYLVKKHTRFNAKESINNRVVQRSKQLLAQSGLIIKEIAYQLGFEDPNNFSTFFQKYAGISPVAFRSASA